MIILYFHLQPQFKYELFHILHIIKCYIENSITALRLFYTNNSFAYGYKNYSVPLLSEPPFKWSPYQGRNPMLLLSIQSGVHLIEVIKNRNQPKSIYFSVRVRLIEVSAE